MAPERIGVPLVGCSTEPLSDYLKALGVFRLVSEQADPDARGYWKNGVFVLQSKFGREELADFFLTKYAPTPIISPWNKDGGFLEDKKSTKSLSKIRESAGLRLEVFREAITSVQKTVEVARKDGLPLEKIDNDKAVKNKLIARLRNALPDKAVKWMDAVLVITSAEADWKGFPLLGSGGNDGRTEFAGAFVERIATIIADDANPNNKRNLLNNALFGLQTDGFDNGIFGQLNPSAVGNFNASNDFTSEKRANPWDYVLAMEGTLVFAGAAVRKFNNKRSDPLMAFPFSVRSSVSGYGTAAKKEKGVKIRSELWLPTWGKPTSITEIESLFSEGRAEFSGRSARTTLEFAQSVAALGIDRGLTEFHRYAFIQRNGKAFFAVKLDTFDVNEERDMDLLREPIKWVGVQNIRKTDPEAKANTLREIEENLLRLCHRGFENPEPAMETIAACGKLMQEAAKSKDGWELKLSKILAADWLEKANDSSAEFRLAASLAYLLRFEFDVYIEKKDKKKIETEENKGIIKDVKKWLRFAGEPVRLVNVIMADRIMRLKQRGKTAYSENAPISARLGDVNDFMTRRLDDRKIVDLMFGLMFLKWDGVRENFGFKTNPEEEPFPGAGYALTKLCHTGIDFGRNEIRLVPAIHKRLASGDEKKALELAVRRLRADGCRIPKYEGLAGYGPQCERIAAALLFPLDHKDIMLLKRRILEREKR